MEYEVIQDRLWDKSVKPIGTFPDYMAAKKEKEKQGKGYIIVQKLTASSLSVQVAEVYCFRFKGTGGWANYTVCEATGEFSIQSDWGDYSYRWNSIGIKEDSLKKFLIQADSHYITDKFSYNKPREFAAKFDSDATIKAIQEEILKRRRERDISQDRARALWFFVDQEIKHSEDCENIYLLHDRLSDDIDYTPPHGSWESYTLLDFLGDDYMCHGPVYNHSQRYDFCIQTLVPFFQDFLREKLNAASKEKESEKSNPPNGKH